MTDTDGTYYDLLKVTQSATTAEIRRAYRALAKAWHPDVNSHPDATMMMARLNCAWEALGDPVRRRAYDLANLPPSLRPGAPNVASGRPSQSTTQARQRQREADARTAAERRAEEAKRRAARERAMAAHIEGLRTYRGRLLWELRGVDGLSARAAGLLAKVLGTVLAFPALYGPPVWALSSITGTEALTWSIPHRVSVFLGLAVGGWLLSFLGLITFMGLLERLSSRWFFPRIIAAIPTSWRYRPLGS